MILRPYGSGVILEEGDARIAVDVPSPVRRAKHIVTHAHLDHMGAARKIPATGTLTTAYLASTRGGHVEPVKEFEHIVVGSLEVELIPAGHIPGSAQVFVHNGRDVLITGDFKLEKDVVEIGAETPEADVLVLETTFGHPHYVFPPRKELYEKIKLLIKKSRELQRHTIIFAYEVGKAQEITAFLNSLGIAPVVTRQAHAANTILGLEDTPIGSPGWKEVLEEPTVLVLPTRFSEAIHALRISLGDIITLRASGWNPRFPLSSHADYRQTLEFVKRVSPEVVVTYGRNALIMARILTREGYDAIPLTRTILV